MQKILKKIYVVVFVGLMFPACAQQPDNENNNKKSNVAMDTFEIKKSDEEWRKLLSPVQFNILREKGTERPFTGEYDDLFEEGTYSCAACGTELFKSKSKYNSGCGWPAFYEPSTNKNIIEKRDYTHGMVRTEVMCAKCGGHLGHVFNDGPQPTGLRYCINSGALKFEEGKKKSN
jgi:peptide-methionine (R)-S-oxide reductase